jgi:prepilin-type N-terminal cleavage/methylation domain-containing protein
MSTLTLYKRKAARGFTLIELLIVVIILAILSAIAIPQFTASTGDAQLAALDSNLSGVRTALEQYKVQHTGNVYPGVNAAAPGQNSAACTTGGTGAAGTSAAMLAQLQYYTDDKGAVCMVKTADYKYGPYLRQGLPAEPFSNVATVAFTATGAPVATAGGKGWAYSADTGQFISANLNTDGVTSNPRKYSDH